MTKKLGDGRDDNDDDLTINEPEGQPQQLNKDKGTKSEHVKLIQDFKAMQKSRHTLDVVHDILHDDRVRLYAWMMLWLVIFLAGKSLFPTCQVRVVRFYLSSSRLFANVPAQCAPLDLSLGPAQLSVHRNLGPCQLSVHRCRAQCAPLNLNLGPCQLSVHRWTSTWDPASSVCTAGPQPGTLPAQCAPLDLNLGRSQLSVHRWSSTAR